MLRAEKIRAAEAALKLRIDGLFDAGLESEMKSHLQEARAADGVLDQAE